MARGAIAAALRAFAAGAEKRRDATVLLSRENNRGPESLDLGRVAIAARNN